MDIELKKKHQPVSVVLTYVDRHLSSDGLLNHLVNHLQSGVDPLSPTDRLTFELTSVFESLCCRPAMKEKRAGATLSAIGSLSSLRDLANINMNWPAVMEVLGSCFVYSASDSLYGASRSPEIVKIMDHYGLDLTHKGAVPLHQLTLQAVKYYFQDFDIEAPVNRSNATLLAACVEASEKNKHCLEFLIGMGTDVNAVCGEHGKPIHFLNPFHRVSLGKFNTLVNHGANPGEPCPFLITEDNRTDLSLAVKDRANKRVVALNFEVPERFDHYQAFMEFALDAYDDGSSDAAKTILEITKRMRHSDKAHEEAKTVLTQRKVRSAL